MVRRKSPDVVDPKVFNLTKEDNVCQYVVRREAGKKKKAHCSRICTRCASIGTRARELG